MPELRKDPIVGRWVIISTDRAKRPTDFVREGVKIRGGFCPFCYGNESKTPPEIQAYRPSANGGPPPERDSPGWTVRVVPNKFPALGIEGDLNRQAEGMFDKMNGIGAHEVVIETPDHNATLATLPAKRIEDVLWTFRDRILDLKKDRRFKYILIFKNHGEAAGASLEHSHSQMIALPIIPIYVTEELEGAKQYFIYKERCVFCDIIRQETESGVRVVAENEDFITLAPYAPRFPFETWILPKRHESAYENSSSHMFENLAKAVKTLLIKADHVLDNPPYNLVVHTSPVQEPTNDHYHWHIEFMPKLTKTAGFEWGTGFYINPTPPEEAAKFLREASVEEASAGHGGIDGGTPGLGLILELLVPSHLDGFELTFTRLLRIIGELGKFGHVAMQVGIAHRQRIETRMLLDQQKANVLSIIPAEFFRHRGSFSGFGPSCVCPSRPSSPAECRWGAALASAPRKHNSGSTPESRPQPCPAS